MSKLLDQLIIDRHHSAMRFAAKMAQPTLPAAHELDRAVIASRDEEASIALEAYGDRLMADGKPRKASDAYGAAVSYAGGSANMERYRPLTQKSLAAVDADDERIKRELGFDPHIDQDLPAWLWNRDWGYDWMLVTKAQ